MCSSLRYSLSNYILVCASVLTLSISSSLADSATKTYSITGNVQDAFNAGQVTLPDFDSSLGELQSIQLTLTIHDTSKIQVYNTSCSPVDFTNASIQFPGSVSGPGGLSFSLDLGASLASGTAKPGLNTFSGLTSTQILSQGVGTASFGLFEDQASGVVTFDYLKGNPTYQGTDGGHSLFFGGSESGAGELKVVYTYLTSAVQPTPEPAGAFLSLLVALAMAALAAGRMRFLHA